MPIKNWTTEVEAERTAGEIAGYLASRGARRIEFEYDQWGKPAAITFGASIEGRQFAYRLPVRPQAVLEKLTVDKAPAKYRNLDQARRIAWRIVKDWLVAQFSLVDAGGAELGEIFMPYLIIAGPGGSGTFYQHFLEHQERYALPAAPAQQGRGA
jgi:hypothetical protein